MKKFQLLLLGSILVSPLHAGDLGFSKEPIPFTNYPVGARIAAMGGAGIAVIPTNNSSTHMNPALGTLLDLQNFTTTSGLLDFDRNFYHAGYSIPFNWNLQRGFFPIYKDGENINNRSDWYQFFSPLENQVMTIGLSATMYGIEGIEGRSAFGQREPDFKDIERSYNINYGWRFYDNLALGFNVKILNQSIHTANSKGMAFDAGLWYGVPRFKWGKLDIGLVFKDLNGELEWEVNDPTLGSTFKYTEKIPGKSMLGISYQSRSEKFTATVDAVKVNEQTLRAHTGFEYAVNPIFLLRAGANAYDPTAGIGVLIPFGDNKINLDYAFQYGLEELANPHWLTLSLKWGSKFKYSESSLPK